MSSQNVQSFKVVSTLAAQRIVCGLSGTANTVAFPENLQRLPYGITIDTVLDTGGAIPVAGPGSISKLFFNDTVGANALVASDSSGRGVPLTLPNTTTSLSTVSAYVGSLVDAAVAATGTVANVLINPGFIRA